MICLLDVTTISLFYYFTSFVIKHSFLSNSVYPWAVFVGLLFLRYGIAFAVLTHAILEIVFTNYFSIWPHFWWANKTLADIWSLNSSLMYIFVGIRELKHVLKWISTEAHHSPKERIICKSSKTSHHLIHSWEGIHTIYPLNLLILATSSSTHFRFNN